MKILVYGSLNLDYVYQLDHIVRPGETISSARLDLHPGGKGLNQAIALARAGAPVWLAGGIGPDGELLRQVCRENGVDDTLVQTLKTRTGNAIIQVAADGQNSIVLYGGANRANTPEAIDRALAAFGAGDLLLLQNEVNRLDLLVEKAAAKGLRVALNPSPCDEACLRCGLDKVSLFLLNEVEGRQITGETEPDAILDRLREQYPAADTVLTLGGDGVALQTAAGRFRYGIYEVSVVDTTAAGDTFTGFFLRAYTAGESPETCLEEASLASSLAVSRPGAVPSIPTREEMLAAKGKLRLKG